MDNLHSPEYGDMKKWITGIFGAAFKDNPSLEKAVLTGVTLPNVNGSSRAGNGAERIKIRVAKENMFSGLNNLKVYDVLKESVYDTDFSLTENELLELIPEEQIDGVRRWYNNMRVGNAMLYNIYSVMNYLSDPESMLQGYWAMSGNESLFASLINKDRAEIIARMIDDGQYRYSIALDSQLNMEHLKNVENCNDISFYTLAVQTGYLSFERIDSSFFNVFIPNEEAKRVWMRLFLDTQYKDPISKITDIFNNISDTERFSKRLVDFASMTLSYHDVAKDQTERLYHVFFFGLLYAVGYKCESNREAGLGRPDIVLRMPDYNAILEFKLSELDTDETMQKEAELAIEQIDRREYWYELRKSPLPIYKIGIACHGKKCAVKTVRHI